MDDRVTISVTRYIEDISSSRWQFVDPSIGDISWDDKDIEDSDINFDYLALNEDPYTRKQVNLRRITTRDNNVKLTTVGRSTGKNVIYDNDYTYELAKKRRNYEVLLHKENAMKNNKIYNLNRVSQSTLRRIKLNNENINCQHDEELYNIPFRTSL